MTRRRTIALLLLLTAAAIAIQGYHPGLEDDAYYLAAIKRDLNPALFPHDADFFRLQFQATIYDKLIAASIRITHLPPDLTIFLWQLAVTLAILAVCLAIARRCFQKPEAHWSATAAVAALLTIPVSGTGISLTDQYLHPRALATAAILAAIVAILDNRYLRAALFLVAAAAVHVIMAAFGLSLCFFLSWRQLREDSRPRSGSSARAILACWVCWLPSGAKLGRHAAILASAALPLHWLFQPTTEAWRAAANTRHFNHLTAWPWYEWLGVIAPFFILYYFGRQARIEADKRSQPKSATRARFSTALLYYALFQFAVALIILLPPQLERLRPFEPMRYLHLVYLLMFLIGGGLIGDHILGKNIYRWLLLFLPLSAGMFYAQRQMYPATAHLEFPGRAPSNDYLRAFQWIRGSTIINGQPRANTPVDALFALDPYYMEQPGEDFHGFRALAERSSLADMVKDPGMVARVPTLAEIWQSEVNATKNWQNFQSSDFARLKTTFGVTWVVLAKSTAASQAATDLICPYQNQTVEVCRIE
ncbi:MAG: hypothetical protein WCB53_14315 [Terriglobales bacterium]